MNEKILLAKCISLLYRESLIKDKTENSASLVATLLENIKPVKHPLGIGKDGENIENVKKLLIEMVNQPVEYEYVIDDLLQQIKLSIQDDDAFYEAVKDNLTELPENQIKRSITNTRKSLETYFRDEAMAKILSDAATKIKFDRDSIKNMTRFVDELVAQIEPYRVPVTAKDPAIITEMNLSDPDTLKEVFNDIKEAVSNKRIYRTGWQALNRMLQGGFRPGEFTLMSALQHKYKTGVNLTLFKQVCMLNKPYTTDPTKKPAIVRFGFEDMASNDILFLYQNLKYNETKEPVSIKDVSEEEMTSYVTKKLSCTGFTPFMLRVDPTKWTYIDLLNYITRLESNGYAVEGVFIDYLMLVPTVGCDRSGAQGTDMRDMIRRVRNFFVAKKIFVVTPHQLSTDAKSLLRVGTPEVAFVKEIAGKGYYAGSKQLDQDVDLEIHQHLFKHNGSTYLAFQRGKHRLPTIPNEEDLFFIFKFPVKMPIPDDIDGEDISMKKITSGQSSSNEALFDF